MSDDLRQHNMLTEEMRSTLMKEHSGDWDMETVAEAAYICSNVALLWVKKHIEGGFVCPACDGTGKPSHAGKYLNFDSCFKCSGRGRLSLAEYIADEPKLTDLLIIDGRD